MQNLRLLNAKHRHTHTCNTHSCAHTWEHICVDAYHTHMYVQKEGRVGGNRRRREVINWLEREDARPQKHRPRWGPRHNPLSKAGTSVQPGRRQLLMWVLGEVQRLHRWGRRCQAFLNEKNRLSKKAQAGNLWVDPGAEDDCRYERGGARKLCLPNWKFRSLMSAAQNLNDGISGFIVKEASTCWPMKTAFYFNLRHKDR